MTEGARGRIGPWRRYGPWVAGPAMVLAAALLLEPRGGHRALEDEFVSDPRFAEDRKTTRTLRAFDTDSVRELPAVGGEGLPVDIELDPTALRLRLVKENRERLKGRRVDAFVRFGDAPAVPATLRLRGATTLRWGEKLNLVVDLLHPQPFRAGFAMQQLYLMAMADDPHQVVARFGYTAFHDLGLYPPFVQYASVRLNGEPAGAYLLLEPPVPALRRRFPDLVALHRRRRIERYGTYWAKDVPRVGASLDGLRDTHWEELDDPVRAYERYLDLDAYLTAVAANSVLLNRDWLGELFFYERRADPRQPGPLTPMAWDPDDLGSTEAKEGAVDDPLVFSGLDYIERRIRDEPAMRAAYRGVLGGVLRDQLTPEYLVATLRAVQAMRDGFDDGLPPAVQDAARIERGAFVSELELRLRARHGELSRLLDASL